jgi:hypothetical protein
MHRKREPKDIYIKIGTYEGLPIMAKTTKKRAKKDLEDMDNLLAKFR